MGRENKIYSSVELDSLSSAILNALDAQVAIIDDTGTILAYNTNWSIFRDNLEHAWCHPDLGVNILQSLQLPLSEGDDNALRLLIGIKEVLAQEVRSFESKCLFRNKDNDPFWFKVTVSHLQNEGGAIIILEDISEKVQKNRYLKETQQKFESHFHNSLYGILVADENNVIIEANKVACKLLETKDDDIIFSGMSDYIDMDMNIERLQKRINRNGNHIGEMEIRSSSGNLIPVEMSVTLFRNEDGKYVTSWAFNDISERKITENTLKQTEQQFELQFTNTLEGIIIGRPNGQLLTVNPAACDILGYSREELEGNHRDLIFDPEIPLNSKALSYRQENGKYTGEVYFTHKEGHVIPVEVSSVIFRTEDDTEKSIINIKDISERKYIQRQLIEEKEFTESAISSLPTAFFVFTTEGEMIRWNDILEEDLGYTARELARINVMKLIHPEDRHKLRNLLESESIEQKVSIEIRCLTKNRDTIYYLLRGSSFSQNGKTYVVGGGLNRNDIREIDRERKRSTELLTQLFYNSPVGIVLMNTDGTIENVNASFEKTFEYTKEEVIGKSLVSAIVPENTEEEIEALTNQYLTGESFQTETIRVSKSGKEIPVLMASIPVVVDKRVIAVYGLYVDISERKELESRILELLKTEQTARLHMQDMFEEAPSAIAVLEGPEHKFSFVNDNFKELVGEHDILNKTIEEVSPELRNQGLADMLDICYQKGQSYTFNERAVYFKKKGDRANETHYLNFVYKPLHNNNDQVYGIFIQAVDVTEQVETRNLIEKSLQEKETLLVEVHHRVKNNLAIISGLLELEIMSVENSEVSKHLNSTQSRIKTIAKVHELLYQNESLSHVNFREYMESVLSKNNKLMQSGSSLISDFELADVHLNVNQAIPAGMLLNEILEHLSDSCLSVNRDQTNQLSFKMRAEKNNVIIDLIDPAHRVLDFLKSGSCSQNTLRNELIEVLLTQLYGEISISEGELSSISITFPKKETKGPHSALQN